MPKPAATDATDASPRARNEQISLLLLLLNEAGRADMMRCAAQLGLPFPQANALLRLDTPISMRDLAVKLHCDASNITGLIDGLEGSGLVQRQVNPVDRRAKFVVLTRKGRQVRERYRSMSFDDVPGLAALTPAEQETLQALLTRMHAGTGYAG